jgi:hypothetical protein
MGMEVSPIPEKSKNTELPSRIPFELMSPLIIKSRESRLKRPTN